MKGILKKLKGFSFFDTFKHSSVYFSGTLLIQALGLLSFPVFLFFMDKAEYGIISIFLSYVNIVSVVLSLNLHLSIGRYYHEKNPDVKGFVSTILMATVLVNFSFGIPIYIYRAPIAAFINLPVETIGLLLVTGYIGVIYYIFFQLKREQKKSHEISIISVLWQYIKFGTSVIGMYWVSTQAGAVFLGKIGGELAGSVLFAILFIIRIRKFINFRTAAWRHLVYAIKYSIPLIPYSIGGYLLNSFDQWIINSELGNGDAGLYSFAYKIGMLLLGLISALQSAGNPDYNQWMNEKDYAKVRAQAFSIQKLSVLGALFMLLFAVDVGTILLWIVKRDGFQEALDIVPAIVVGYAFYGLALLYSRGINYKKVNIYLTFILLCSSAVNIILNIYFIKVLGYGYQIAAYTTLISYILMALLCWLVTSIWLKIPDLQFGKMMLIMLLLLFISAGYYWTGWHQIGFHWGLIPLKTITLGLVAVALFYQTLKKILTKK